MQHAEDEQAHAAGCGCCSGRMQRLQATLLPGEQLLERDDGPESCVARIVALFRSRFAAVASVGAGAGETALQMTLAALPDSMPVWMQLSAPAARVVARRVACVLGAAAPPGLEARLAWFAHPENQTLLLLASRVVADCGGLPYVTEPDTGVNGVFDDDVLQASLKAQWNSMILASRCVLDVASGRCVGPAAPGYSSWLILAVVGRDLVVTRHMYNRLLLVVHEILWDTAGPRASPNPFHLLRGHNAAISTITAAGPDVAASGDWDGKVCVYNVRQGQLIMTWQHHTAWVNTVCYLQPGTTTLPNNPVAAEAGAAVTDEDTAGARPPLIVSTSTAAPNVCVTNMLTGKVYVSLARPAAQDDVANACAQGDPDNGAILAVGYADGTVVLWNVEQATQVHQFLVDSVVPRPVLRLITIRWQGRISVVAMADDALVVGSILPGQPQPSPMHVVDVRPRGLIGNLIPYGPVVALTETMSFRLIDVPSLALLACTDSIGLMSSYLPL